MSKHSGFERQRRADEAERMREVERAWRGSVPSDRLQQFEGAVAAVQARGPQPPPPDMAPGTPPNPPRIVREPKPTGPERGNRGRR